MLNILGLDVSKQCKVQVRSHLNTSKISLVMESNFISSATNGNYSLTSLKPRMEGWWAVTQKDEWEPECRGSIQNIISLIRACCVMGRGIIFLKFPFLVKAIDLPCTIFISLWREINAFFYNFSPFSGFMLHTTWQFFSKRTGKFGKTLIASKYIQSKILKFPRISLSALPL